MNGIGRECRQADGNVFGCFVGSGILSPFAGMRDHGLSGHHFKLSLLVAYSKATAQDDGVLFKFRSLSGLLPSRGAAHVGHAEASFPGVQPPNVFVYDFGHVARGLNARRCFNELWQWLAPLFPTSSKRPQKECRTISEYCSSYV